MNVQLRVESRAGLIAALQGESQGKALERALPKLNSQGYRVVFMVKDRWSFFRVVLFALVAICTLGLWTKVPDWVIVGERVSD